MSLSNVSYRKNRNGPHKLFTRILCLHPLLEEFFKIKPMFSVVCQELSQFCSVLVYFLTYTNSSPVSCPPLTCALIRTRVALCKHVCDPSLLVCASHWCRKQCLITAALLCGWSLLLRTFLADTMNTEAAPCKLPCCVKQSFSCMGPVFNLKVEDLILGLF